MENQHRKIAGYRELSEGEIDLMNRVKIKGAEMLELQKELVATLSDQAEGKKRNVTVQEGSQADPDDLLELSRFYDAEPMRWAAIAKTDLQTGIMALVRAIAQPAI